MANVKIIADSTCDLSRELLARYDIQMIPLYIQLDEKSYLDQIQITPPELYEWSDKNGRTPKTAAPGIDVVQGILEKYTKVHYLQCGAAGSGGYGVYETVCHRFQKPVYRYRTPGAAGGRAGRTGIGSGGDCFRD